MRSCPRLGRQATLAKPRAGLRLRVRLDLTSYRLTLRIWKFVQLFRSWLQGQRLMENCLHHNCSYAGTAQESVWCPAWRGEVGLHGAKYLTQRQSYKLLFAASANHFAERGHRHLPRQTTADQQHQCLPGYCWCCAYHPGSPGNGQTDRWWWRFVCAVNVLCNTGYAKFPNSYLNPNKCYFQSCWVLLWTAIDLSTENLAIAPIHSVITEGLLALSR